MYLDGGFAQDIRDAFEPPHRRYDDAGRIVEPMPNLSVREGGPDGDHDAWKYGYWHVSGPQPETEVFGMILLLVGDEYEWEVHRRVAPEKNTTSTYVALIKHGRVPTYDHALAALSDAWPTADELAGDPVVKRADVPWASIRTLGEEEDEAV